MTTTTSAGINFQALQLVDPNQVKTKKKKGKTSGKRKSVE
jgi:hypothetical protein